MRGQSAPLVATDEWVIIDGWLQGRPERIYAMLSGDGDKSRLNSMREMRAAYGLPTHNGAIPEWLRFWDSLSQDERLQLRRMDLNTLNESGMPVPPQPIGEDA